MLISEVIPSDGRPQRNYCDGCGCHLELGYADFDEVVSGVHIRIEGLPTLICSACCREHLPDLARLAILNVHKDAVDKQSAEVAVIRRKRKDEFKFTRVPFLYDPDDYYYIPGLYRSFDVGFLTPVFFKRQVLLKFDNSPDYSVQFASATYGTIDTKDNYISFGINRHGNVVMWLGDIAKLPESEQFYLRSENIPSDHSIGSEFYDGQIECRFTDPSKESLLFKARSRFVDACFKRLGTKIAHLDDEVLDLAQAFNAPVVDTEKERQHVADTLNKIYIESLDNKALAKLLTGLGVDPKGMRSLKCLQAVLEEAIPTADVSSLLSPFYVLYDLRVAYSHLGSRTKAAATLETVCTRLGLTAGAGLTPVYEALRSGLTLSFETLAEELLKP